MDIQREGQFLAHELDRNNVNEVTSRLQQDSQQMDPRGYSALLQTINRYDQKGVGADLMIVDNHNGTQEALIRQAAPPPIDVGTINPEPPPQYYQQPPVGYNQQRPNDTTGCTLAGAGIGAVLGNILSGRHDKAAGTIVGGVAGGVIGNDHCR